MNGKPVSARGLAGLWLLWLGAGLLPAWLAFRYLYADGAAVLIEIIRAKAFFFPWNGRELSEILEQGLAVLALQWGVQDFRIIAGCFGVGMMFAPPLIHGLALGVVLRRGGTVPAAVYLVMLWLLQLYSGLMAVTESHAAAAVFLLAAVVISGPRPPGRREWAALALAGLAAFWLYEFWFFYGIQLLLVAGWRWGRREPGLDRGGRILAWIAGGLLLAGVLANLRLLLGSGGNANRVSFMQMMSGTTLPVYLALITGWFVAFCGHVWLSSGGRAAGISRRLPPANVRHGGLLVSLLALLALSAFQFDTMVRYSYPFRVLNLALPMIYVAWLAFSGPHPAAREWPAGLRTLLLVLTAALLIHETRLTLSWNRYQDWVVQVPTGGPDSKFVAQPPDTRLAQTWIYPWTHSAHSFAVQALRSGRVTAVGHDPGTAFNPYGPAHEDVLRAVAAECGIAWE